ncbi:MAG: TetR/AcrR family transcriptional regulator [Clostridia bacterium]|nr:TetR/AcrR family transcriptional regulator [Clostridia bacterium]
MAKKQVITAEYILKGALEYIKTSGIEQITARKLADYLSCSTQPIYSYFENLDILKEKIIQEIYNAMNEEMLKESEDPFLQLGLGVVTFAKKHPEWFRSLYFSHKKSKMNLETIRGRIEKNEYVVENKINVESLHRHLTIYTHGLACLVMDQPTLYSEDEIVKMIRTAAQAFGREYM